MPTPNEPNLSSGTLASEVGVCPHCQALLTLPFSTEPFDSIGCPACEQTISIDEVALRKVQVAKAIPQQAESLAKALPTVADLLATATAPKRKESLAEEPMQESPVLQEPEQKESATEELAPVESSTTPDPGHESLDDWLRRTTGVPTASDAEAKLAEANPTELPNDDTDINKTIASSPTLADPPSAEVKLAEKKSLSETLGWNPGAFSLETPDEVKTNSDPIELAETAKTSTEGFIPDETNASLNTKKTVENIDRFVSSLREETSSPSVEPTPEPVTEAEATPAAPLEEFQFDFKRVLDESDIAIEQEETENTDFLQEIAEEAVLPAGSIGSRNRVGWGAPLSALAGLLVVGGVSYVVLVNQFLNDEATAPNELAIVEPVDVSSIDTKVATPETSDTYQEQTERGVEVANFESAEPIDAKSNAEESYRSNAPAEDRYSQQHDRYSEPNPFAVADAQPVAPQDNTQETANTQPVEEQASFNEPLATDQLTQEEAPFQRFYGAPTYGLDELEAAYDYSSPAGKSFTEGSLGDANQAQEMGKWYGDLCYLAQVITLLDQQDMPNGLKTAELLAVDVYKKMLLSKETSEEINQVASHWINWTGRPYGGVFFQGIPDDMQRAGELYQYRFPLGDSFVFVVTEEPIDINRYIINDAKKMGIVGIVVEEPNDRIEGYEGDADRIIWCRKTIAISDSRWTP